MQQLIAQPPLAQRDCRKGAVASPRQLTLLEDRRSAAGDGGNWTNDGYP